jgi:adenosylmethionine---8-amino-7-oxononanoate aminotransferase
VCLAAREFGLLTRPVLDTLVLMLPYCVTDAELEAAVGALAAAIEACCLHQGQRIEKAAQRRETK